MDCPKCRTVNPDSSRFCGACASPLHPEEDLPSVTTTIDPLARGVLAGTVIAGKYRILGEIGRGGMGIVYEADDIKLRRAVALKFLPLELTDDPEARERFIHEAQAASVLDNPHICTIHEIGESEDRRMFIAMALCTGESLRAKIKRAPLDPAEALSYAAQVADGLAAAHAAGIVHRDIKPANVLLSKDGSARIADFGLAKITGEARLTQAGRAVGTVAYMSPEQLRGEDVDARSDVWSLGIVLYEMLTGALPFHGTNEHSLAYAIVNSETKPLDELPPGTPAGCVHILKNALAKDPSARFSSAVEMAGAIAAVRETAGYTGHVRNSTGKGSPLTRPRPAVVRFGLPILAAGGVLAVALAFHVPLRLAVLLGLTPPSSGRHITIFAPTPLGDNQPDRILAEGLAEYLRLRLDEIARRSRSWVTPAGNARTYDVREASDARRVLGSNLVITGTLKRVGDNLSLTLDVFDPVRFRRRASFSKSDHIANIATWQDDLIREAAAAVGLPAVPAGEAALTAAGTTVPGAFEAYIRGLGILVSADPASLPGSAGSADLVAAAIEAFEEAVRLDPSFVAASIDLAEAYMQKAAPGKDKTPTEHAEALVRSLLKINDSLARGHLVLGRILLNLGRNDEAGSALEKAAALDPLYYEAQIELGVFYQDTNEPARAEAMFRAALRARPGYWTAGVYLGLFYFYQGAYDKARDEFEEVARFCPGNILILNDLGAAHFKLGEYARAIAAFERSNAVKRNPEACSNLGVLYYYSGRYAESVNQNEAAIGFGPTEFAYLIWGNLADAYRFTPGNEVKAAEAYKKAIELTEEILAADPGDARSRACLAVYLAKSGEGKRAREEIERALGAKPDDNNIVLHEVIVYELVGERPRALESVREYERLKGPMDEIVRDPFLAALRRDPGYTRAIAGKSAG